MLLRPRQILAPIVFATVFGYFGYHLVNGDRGLLAMAHLQREVLVAEQNLAEAEASRKIWERRVAALRNQSLDPDMLDERARILLNFARKDDTINTPPRIRPSTSPTAAPISNISRSSHARGRV